MKPRLFVPPLDAAHEQRLRQGLRSADAFTARRCQILLASARGEAPSQIARHLGCTPATVRNALHAFAREDLACLQEQSSRPHSARPFLTDPSQAHVLHYTRKHGSWLNQVEMWFSVLARRVIRRGNFVSKADLARKILAYIVYHNAGKAHPNEWTYTGKPLVAEAKS